MKQAFFAENIYYDSMPYKNSWLLTDGAIIEGISANKPESGYDLKEFSHSAIFPGLINTHTHLGMSLFRGMADDLPLMTWLSSYIWPAEKKSLNFDFVYLATLLSAAESIRSGVTCLNDMYFFAEAGAKAFRKAGIRGLVGFGIMNDTQKAFRRAEAFKTCDLVKVSICPHALYTVGPDIVKESAAFAKEKGFLFQTHLAETLDETAYTLEKYGKTPAFLIDETGAFDYEKSIFAHCIHLDEKEIELMGAKKVGVSHCVESNLKLASGFAPIQKLIEAGARVSIGTDGAASNNNQSMIGEMACVSKLHKVLNMDATAFSARHTLDMATKNGASCIGYDGIGVLKQGNFADFFVLSFDAAHMTPMYDPISHLIYAAENHDVTDVYVAGKPIMKNRIIQTFDEEEVKVKAREKIKSIRG